MTEVTLENYQSLAMQTFKGSRLPWEAQILYHCCKLVEEAVEFDRTFRGTEDCILEGGDLLWHTAGLLYSWDYNFDFSDLIRYPLQNILTEEMERDSTGVFVETFHVSRATMVQFSKYLGQQKELDVPQLKVRLRLLIEKVRIKTGKSLLEVATRNIEKLRVRHNKTD